MLKPNYEQRDFSSGLVWLPSPRTLMFSIQSMTYCLKLPEPPQILVTQQTLGHTGGQVRNAR